MISRFWNLKYHWLFRIILLLKEFSDKSLPIPVNLCSLTWKYVCFHKFCFKFKVSSFSRRGKNNIFIRIQLNLQFPIIDFLIPRLWFLFQHQNYHWNLVTKLLEQCRLLKWKRLVAISKPNFQYRAPGEVANNNIVLKSFALIREVQSKMFLRLSNSLCLWQTKSRWNCNEFLIVHQKEYWMNYFRLFVNHWKIGIS